MSNRRKLGRRTEHYYAMMKNLCAALFEHGSINTTISKAKEMRSPADKLITLAKRAFNGDLSARRRALSQLPRLANMSQILDKVGEATQARQGGYVSVRRIGFRCDGAVEANIRILDYKPVKPTETPYNQDNSLQNQGNN